MKGKSAAQSANRKAREAESALIEAKHQLKSKQEEWDKERQSLIAEIRSLKNAQRKGIEAAAAQAIQEAREQVSRDMESQRIKYEERAVKALRMIGDKGFAAQYCIDAATILGINYRDTFDDSDNEKAQVNRTARRRTTNRQMKNLVTGVQDARKAGRPAPDITDVRSDDER